MIFLWLLGSYLCGALPTSYIITKLLRNIDIREHGSGNPGATNVFRVIGPVPGIITFLTNILRISFLESPHNVLYHFHLASCEASFLRQDICEQVESTFYDDQETLSPLRSRLSFL
jgi:hypothetical protein